MVLKAGGSARLQAEAVAGGASGEKEDKRPALLEHILHFLFLRELAMVLRGGGAESDDHRLSQVMSGGGVWG